MILYPMGELEVVRHGLYDDSNPRMGRFVDLLADDGSTYRYTVHADQHDSIPSPGESCNVALEARRVPAARKDRNGDAYVKWETKYRVVSFAASLAKAA